MVMMIVCGMFIYFGWGGGGVVSLISSFQQRLSYSTLGDLALALIDGTVYEIVQGLLDIQHLTEKNLYNQRQKLHCEHQGWCSALLFGEMDVQSRNAF